MSMSGATPKPHTRKRRATEDDGSEDLSQRHNVETTMAAAAAAGAPDPAAAAGTIGPLTEAAAALTSVSAVEGAQQVHASAGVQPLPEQMRKKQRRSPRFSSPLDRLATVELQLCLQFLDAKSKLKAARCSRRLLQAADQPFAWHGPPVAMSSRRRPQLGSHIRQSLLRHAPIALMLVCKMSAEEMAAIPRLQTLHVVYRISDDFAHQLLALPSLRELQTLQMPLDLPPSTLQLLPTLSALHTLKCWMSDDSAYWSWLPAMPALTHLDLTCMVARPIPPTLIDAIGQCAQLQTLRLQYPRFSAGAFARFCSAPAMRRLRHLKLDSFHAQLTVEEYRAAFSALAQLESLRLQWVHGVDRLLPHLAHAPTLRTLTITCKAESPADAETYGARLPNRDALRQLLAAAPLLQVRLEVPASIETWRKAFCCTHEQTSAQRELDEQWRELQRLGAEMERVTVVEPVLFWF
jgi:hypothetical protein